MPQPEWYPLTNCTCYSGKKQTNYWPHGYLELDLAQNAATETVWLEDSSSHYRKLL
jgi:hypothetical protein